LEMKNVQAQHLLLGAQLMEHAIQALSAVIKMEWLLEIVPVGLVYAVCF